MGYSAAPSAFAYPTGPMDERRKKLKFRAWRRGFREIDLILGGFADQHLPNLDAEAVDAFERLLEAPDQDVYLWITGQAPAPPEHETLLMSAIRTFCTELNKPHT